MLSWIIIAIAIATIFGVINFKDLKNKLLQNYNKILPIAQKKLTEIKSKISSPTNNTQNNDKK